MPFQKNILQFSVPMDVLGRLEALAQEGESLNLCAKRLLLGRIQGDQRDRPQPIPDERLEAVERRLEELETSDRAESIPDERLEALERRLDELEVEKRTVEKDRDQLLVRIANLQTENLKLIENPYNQAVEQRNAELEKAIDQMSHLEAIVRIFDSRVNKLERSLQDSPTIAPGTKDPELDPAYLNEQSEPDDPVGETPTPDDSLENEPPPQAAGRFSEEETRDFLREVAGSNQHAREIGVGRTRSKKDISQKLHFDGYPCPYGGEWNVPKLNKFCKERGIRL